MMTPIPAPAKRIAHGLAFPTRPATTEGRPKMPLPMTEFTVSATRLQRPMARMSPDVPAGVVSVTAALYHKTRIPSQRARKLQDALRLRSTVDAVKPAPIAAFQRPYQP